MKFIAVVGSYRKGRIIDTAVAEILRGAAASGAQAETIHLIDRHIEFCRNCRECTQAPGDQPGPCVHRDDMPALIQACLDADVLLLASPVNCGAATAVTKKFLERLVSLAYWPFGQPGPKMRVPPSRTRRAVLISASAAPAILARLPGVGSAQPVLKYIARMFDARVVKKLHYGLAAYKKDTALNEREMRAAFALGETLGRSARRP